MGTIRTHTRRRQLAVIVRDGRLRPWFRRLGFATDLALNSGIMLTLFLVGRATGQVVTGHGPARFLTSFADAHLVVSGALPAGIEATRCGELALRGKEEPVAVFGLTGAPV